VTVYGIDLGTTYSCVAYVGDAARPTVVRLEESDTLPSVVYFERPDNIVVGDVARDALKHDAKNVRIRIKRNMGQQITYEYWGTSYTPEKISAFILRKLASDTATATGDAVHDVVITVPAYFGIAEREATKRAGELAGLNVIDIVNEPIAAAISYGALREGTDRTIFVFDLGGGTFDTTVITMRDGNITTVCIDGDHELGGADWDDELSTYLVEEFRRQHPDAGDPALDEEAVAQIRIEAESVKRRLSAATTQKVRVMHEGLVATVEVTREMLEELTSAQLGRALDITRRTIETARSKGVTKFDDVLLVGGSSIMPAVAQRLSQEFGLTPQLFDPHLAVAKGAAIYAFEETYRQLLAKGGAAAADADRMVRQAGLSESQVQAIRKRQILTVASHAFGVVVFDEHNQQDFVDHLVHANDRLPAEKTETYYTLEDNQAAVRVRVMEQNGAVESEEVNDNTEIVAGDIRMPPGKPRGWPVQVTFLLDRSGLLKITVVERETGNHLDLEAQTRRDA
jgi:molecular chaperone DnaK (HSP70)